MRIQSARPLLLAVATVGALLGGCRAHLDANMHRTQARTPAGEFVFAFEEQDRAAREKVELAIRNASPKLADWGGVREPVQVFVMPTHRALEDAVNRGGYAWLRAWARYDEIFLQSPRTWSVFGATQADVDELVLHELTHTVMYQQAADATHWARKGIPLWFREGMASWTAGQGYRWPTLEDLARFYEEQPGKDPLLDPDPLYQNESDIVYGAAHHAFTFLVARYGTEGVKHALGQMRAGDDFRTAFAEAFAISQERFTKDFQRYVRLRGFRGGRRKVHRAVPVRPKASTVCRLPSAAGSQPEGSSGSGTSECPDQAPVQPPSK